MIDYKSIYAALLATSVKYTLNNKFNMLFAVLKYNSMDKDRIGLAQRNIKFIMNYSNK